MTKKIIIVGGGFAGLNLAKNLSNNKHFEVTVIDKNNYHFFPPLLYQVSTALIESSNICYPFRKLFQDRKNLKFYMGKLLSVIPEINTIETDNGNLRYDYLVLAMGTETNYFGNENIRQNALPMKTVDDALNLRNHILLRMEAAMRSNTLLDKRRLANIVIAGGGPTGVEMAGMLAEMCRNIRDYTEGKPRVGTIYLVDASHALLNTMSKSSQTEAYNVLNELGVRVLLNTSVKDYGSDEVILSNGKKITSATLIWTPGVVAGEVKGLPKEVTTKGRRILVDEINRVQGYSNIFAIGDLCCQTTDKNYSNGHPQLAGVAIKQSKLLGNNLKRLEENRSPIPFIFHHRGSAAIISKYRAVVDLHNNSFKGFFAWFVWLFAHIIPLIGFRNRVKIAANWCWSFMTNDSALRLIIRPDKKENDRVENEEAFLYQIQLNNHH